MDGVIIEDSDIEIEVIPILSHAHKVREERAPEPEFQDAQGPYSSDVVPFSPVSQREDEDEEEDEDELGIHKTDVAIQQTDVGVRQTFEGTQQPFEGAQQTSEGAQQTVVGHPNEPLDEPNQHRRNLRKRTALQLHPYLYDQALYGYLGKGNAQLSLSSPTSDYEKSDVSESEAETLISQSETASHRLSKRSFVVESGSESSSESDPESIEQSPETTKLQYYNGRFTKVIPASHQEEPVYDLDSNSLSQGFEAQEVNDVDHMGPKRTRTPRTYAVSIASIAKSFSGRPLRSTRVAVRTSKRNGCRPDLPTRKFISFDVVESAEHESTLRKWRRGFVERPRRPGGHKRTNQPKPSQPKPSEPTETKPTSKRPKRNQILLDRLIAPENERGSGVTVSYNPTRPPKAPKPKRKRYHNEPEYRTTIVEIPDKHQRSSRALAYQARELHLARERMHLTQDLSVNEPINEPIRQPLNKALQPKREVCVLSPVKKVQFTSNTFLGSGSLVFMRTEMWSLAKTSNYLNPALMESSPLQVQESFSKLRGILSGPTEIHEDLFESIYEWELESAAFINAQESIIDEETYTEIFEGAKEILSTCMEPLMFRAEVLARARLSFCTLALCIANYAKQTGKDQMHCASLCEMTTSVILSHLDSVIVSFENAALGPTQFTRVYCGLELLVAGFRLGLLADTITGILLIPKQVVTSEKVSFGGLWQLFSIYLCTNDFVHTKTDFGLVWELVEGIIRAEMDCNNRIKGRILMARCISLLTTWKARPNTPVLLLFFNYFARQRHYADPNGEAVDLPTFLCTSKFDGNSRHLIEHHVFLEYLGLTLRLLVESRNESECARLASRVMPLSTHHFPETEKLSVSNLSVVSQQYGILLVLIRFCPSQCQPHVEQVLNVSKLRHAHVALRIKAINAWSLLVSILKMRHQTRDLPQCIEWMSVVVDDNVNQYKEFRSEMHLDAVRRLDELFLTLLRKVRVTRVPLWPPLLDLMLEYPPEPVKRELWKYIKSIVSQEGILDQIAPKLQLYLAQGSFSTWEIHEYISVLSNVELKPQFLKWPDPKSEPLFLRDLITSTNVPFTLILDTAAKYISRLTWTNEVEFFNHLDKYDFPLINSATDLGQRIPVIETLVRHGGGRQILSSLQHEFSRLDSARQRYFAPFVASVRQTLFEHQPDLSRNQNWFHGVGQELGYEENGRLQLIRALQDEKNSRMQLEFFLAFKMRECLLKNDTSRFETEVTRMLSLQNHELALYGFDLVVNKIFSEFVDHSPENPVFKSFVPSILRVTLRAVLRSDHLEYDPDLFVQATCRAISQFKARPDNTTVETCVQNYFYSLCCSVVRQVYLRDEPGHPTWGIRAAYELCKGVQYVGSLEPLHSGGFLSVLCEPSLVPVTRIAPAQKYSYAWVSSTGDCEAASREFKRLYDDCAQQKPLLYSGA